jgi:hypothetical protein
LRVLQGKNPPFGFDFSRTDAVEPKPEVEAEPVPEPASEVEAELPQDTRMPLSATVAGLEAAVTAQPDDWEPDGSEDVPVMDWSQAGPEDGPVFRSRHAAPFRLERPVVDPGFHHAARATDVPESDDPDGLSAFDQDSDAALEAEVTAFLSNRTLANEDALRRLIVEIVHQELQGALGERITRNVRKLVRREISRTIASEEFE